MAQLSPWDAILDSRSQTGRSAIMMYDGTPVQWRLLCLGCLDLSTGVVCNIRRILSSQY
jgi:hypothetical protein